MQIEILEKPPLEGARKDIDYYTGEPYVGREDQASEWAVAFAFAKYNIGDVISDIELANAINEAVIQQTLDSLCEKGLLEEMWDDNQIKYRAKKNA